MTFLIRFLSVLLMLCVCGAGQDAAPTNTSADPDAQWLSEMLMPYGGFQEFGRSMEAIRPELEKALTVNRLVQLVRRSASRDLSNPRPPGEATQAAMKLLAFAKTDAAVDVIAPYLRHQLPRVRERAAENLRITQNPKAVPPLKAALLEEEGRLPAALIANPDTEASVATLTTQFRALSMIRSDDALAALDASLDRLRKRYGASEVGGELLRQLQHVRETGGIQEYRRDTASSVPVEPPQPPAPAPSTPALATPHATTTSASQAPATPIAQNPAATVEQRAPLWPWLVGIAALIVIALLVWKRRV